MNAPATAATLRRLVAHGLSRHNAIHAVAGALSRMLFEMSHRMVPFDPVAYERDLAQITAEGWLASTGDPPHGRALFHPHRRHPQRRRHTCR